MSKFVMLDRFSKTLGVAAMHPGVSQPKKRMSSDDLGGASKVSMLFFIEGPFSIVS